MFSSATIGLNIVFAAMVLVPNIPAVYHSMLSVPNIALENSMACRVYRAVKLGLIKNHQSTRFGLSFLSSSAPSAPEQPGHEFASKTPPLDDPHNIQINVDITRTTDMKIRDDDVLGKQSSLA